MHRVKGAERLLTSANVRDGTEVGPASMIVGNLVAGKRIAQACGRDVAQLEDNEQACRARRLQLQTKCFLSVWQLGHTDSKKQD